MRGLGGLIDDVRQALGARLTVTAVADDLPRVAGSYILLIGLEQDLEPGISSLPRTRLTAGWYVYAGSARGPGGIAARAGRHLRRDKTQRWHVDRLTAVAGRVLAAPILDLDECGIVAALSARPGFSVPIAGFGSSDCRTCAAHLLAYQAG